MFHMEGRSRNHYYYYHKSLGNFIPHNTEWLHKFQLKYQHLINPLTFTYKSIQTSDNLWNLVACIILKF